MQDKVGEGGEINKRTCGGTFTIIRVKSNWIVFVIDCCRSKHVCNSIDRSKNWFP